MSVTIHHAGQLSGFRELSADERKGTVYTDTVICSVCKNLARHAIYESGAAVAMLCDEHARGRRTDRLPADPASSAAVEDTAASATGRGVVAVGRGDLKGFMKVSLSSVAGYYCCEELSPSRLGPIAHQQPGLPPALTLERFHRGNQVRDADLLNGSTTTEEWRRQQLRWYSAPNVVNVARGMPLWYQWIQPDGSRVMMSELEARRLYCELYVKQVSLENSLPAIEIEALRDCLEAGYNLHIVTDTELTVLDGSVKALEKLYLDVDDSNLPGVIISAILILPVDHYPWRKRAGKDVDSRQS